MVEYLSSQWRIFISINKNHFYLRNLKKENSICQFSDFRFSPRKRERKIYLHTRKRKRGRLKFYQRNVGWNKLCILDDVELLFGKHLTGGDESWKRWKKITHAEPRYNFLYLFIYQLSATFNVIRRIMSLKLFTYAGNGLCPFTLNGSDNVSYEAETGSPRAHGFCNADTVGINHRF